MTPQAKNMLKMLVIIFGCYLLTILYLVMRSAF